MICSSRCLLFLALAITLSGCPSRSSTPGGGGGKSGSTKTISSKLCNDKLKTAENSLDPRRLEIDAEIEYTRNVVNDWFTSCATPAELDAADLKFFQNFLGEEELQYLRAEQFVSRDIGQIRTNILLRQIAETATAGSKTDLEEVVRLFEYVTRNVIVQPDSRKLPLTLYEVLLFGRATSNHQAWVFAELLRQLRFDSVILTPDSDGADNEWIFVVLLDEGNYLFDFSLLTPVPAGEEAPVWPITQPATLQQIIERPVLLDVLREYGSRVPSAEALKSPAVWIPSESSYWSGRMQAFNRALAGKPYLVADPLLDGENRQGLVSRIDEASDLWERSDIKPWPFPAQQQRGYWSIAPDSSLGQTLRIRKMPFHAPMEFSVNEQTEEVSVRKESNQQWESRLAQLRGSYQHAISTYGRLRLGSGGTKQIFQGKGAEYLQDYLRLEDAAAEDASFWVGISQLELGLHSEAAVTLRDYLNRYPDSKWTDAVHMLVAKIELKNDNPADAAEQLSEVPKSSLMRPAADFIRSRIEASADKESSEETSEVEAKVSP